MIIEKFKLAYKIEKDKSSIRLFGENFYKKNKLYGYCIYENKVDILKEFFETKNLKGNILKIKVIFNRIINDKSFMFENCESLITCAHDIIRNKHF